MSELFKNQYDGIEILKHKELPIYVTNEFRFYRCLTFNENFYGKTVSELHKGNLRLNSSENRYSYLFPTKKTSYWADSLQTARAEVKYHTPSKDLLSFMAYDDATSTFPTIQNREPLIIINALDEEFSKILEKAEDKKKLTDYEKSLIDTIDQQNPDCLVYESFRYKNGLNYLFFEKGFAKLSLRKVELRLGDKQGENFNRIVCANGSDYAPRVESYGMCFSPLARIKECKEYKKQHEYLRRREVYNESLDRYKEWLNMSE